MLVIRDAQIKALEQAAVENFIVELVAHCKEFSPNLAKTLDDSQLETAVRGGVSRAEKHELTQRGPVRFFVDLMIVFGSDFDTDPQYPWISEILSNPDETSQLARSDSLHERTAEYLETVDGEKNVHTLKSLEDLSAKYKQGLIFTKENLDSDLLRLFKEVHPRKYEQTGEELLAKLIANQKAKGRELYGFEGARSLALMAVLAFAFGHGFDKDPFLPWISRTLTRSDYETPEKKAEDLEKRALIWVDAVLKNAREEK